MNTAFLYLFMGCTGTADENEFEIPGTDIVLLRLEPGSFDMGSPEDEIGRGTDEDLHEVRLTTEFWLARTEVTQAQFQNVMGYSNATFADCADCPMETLSWSESVAFANTLSEAEELESCYRCEGSGEDVVCEARTEVYDCSGYRLPTEAEWEYAVRSGSSAPFSEGSSLQEGTETSCDSFLELDGGALLDDFAWFCGNASEGPQPVGGLEPNTWGFYDLHGNVWEMTQDWYEAYGSDVVDPDGASTGSGKVVRGGGWSDGPRFARSAARSGSTIERRTSWLGFRIARSR